MFSDRKERKVSVGKKSSCFEGSGKSKENEAQTAKFAGTCPKGMEAQNVLKDSATPAKKGKAREEGVATPAVRRGRKSTFTPEKMRELVNVACSDYYTVRELAGIFRVSRASVCRALERAETLGMAPELSPSGINL